MIRLLKYVILDIVKNKIVIAYCIMLALFTWSAFGLEDHLGWKIMFQKVY